MTDIYGNSASSITGDLTVEGNIQATDAEFENLEVKNQLRVNEFTFPLSDGTPNQVMATDGFGVVSWINDAIGIPPNLQDSFDLSSKPQITTSNAVGRETMIFKQGAGVTSPILEIEDSSGATKVTINSEGEVKSQKNIIGNENIYEIQPDDSSNIKIAKTAYSTNGGGFGEICISSRGTKTTPLASQSGDTLSGIGYLTFDNVGTRNAGGTSMTVVNSYVAPNLGSTEFKIETLNNGSTLPTEKLKCNNNGVEIPSGLVIGNSPTNYTMPEIRGTDGQVMKIDNSGVVTWQNEVPSSLTLQESFDASLEPQITTTVTNDTLLLKQGIGVPSSVLEIQDNTGTTILEVGTGTISMPVNVVRQQPLTGQAFQSISAPGAGFSTLGVGQFANTATTCSLQGQQTSITVNGGTSSDLFLISGTDEYKFENLASNDKLVLEKNDVVRVSFEDTETKFGPDGFVVLKDTGDVECKDMLVKSFNPTIQFEGATSTSQSLINLGTPANTQNAFIQLYSNTASAIDLASEKRTFLRWGNQNVPIDEFCIERDFNVGVGDVEFIFRPFGGATKRIPITIPTSGNQVKINKINVNDQYTLPDVDGSPNQVLVTNGSGDVTWENETASTETLQQAFSASTSPQIVTDSTNPTLTIKADVSNPPLIVSDQLSNPIMVVETTGQVVLPRLNDSSQKSLSWLTQNNPTNSWDLGSVISSSDLSFRNGTNANILRLSQTGEVRINDSYDLPTTAGTSGQYLRTDGSNSEWGDIPTQAQFVQTSTTSIPVNSTVLTELTSNGLGTRLIPANTLVVGSSYRICFRGLCETDGTLEDITFFLRINDGVGNTTVIGQMNVDFTNVAALSPYDAEFNFTVRTIGNNGTCATSGQFNYMDNNSLEGDKSNGLSSGLDTTSDQTIELFGVWSAAEPSNVLIMNQFTMERLSGSTTGNTLFSTPVTSVDVLQIQTAITEFQAMKNEMQNAILKIHALTGS